MLKLTHSMIAVMVTLGLAIPASGNEVSWEYQVVILQGVSAGGSIKRQASGIAVDSKKTRMLNELAAEGWEVIAIVGAPIADHAVYLKRKQRD